jgi:hypothetical protein
MKFHVDHFGSRVAFNALLTERVCCLLTEQAKSLTYFDHSTQLLSFQASLSGTVSLKELIFNGEKQFCILRLFNIETMYTFIKTAMQKNF